MQTPDRSVPPTSSSADLVHSQDRATAISRPAPGGLAPPLLRQTSLWSRAILWCIVGVTSFALVWACLADFEEAVAAQGRLEPRVPVREVRIPIDGVVKEVFVRDGTHVKQGEVLLTLDSTAALSQIRSLEQIAASLMEEDRFYRRQLSEQAPTPVALLSPAVQLLSSSRSALMSENRVYRAQMRGDVAAGASGAENERVLAGRSELDSRATVARYEIEQLEKQKSQNASRASSARASLEINRRILSDIKPLAEQGGLARVQYLNQILKVQQAEAELEQYAREAERFAVLIAQARQKLRNTVATARQDLLARIAQNEQKISQVDSQFSKQMLENEKRSAEIRSQLSQLRLTLNYQQVRSPADGTVFDLKAHRASVTNSREAVLKIVPEDALLARVFVTNREIGFVREGLNVDVRLDSFPYGEFGDIKGRLVWIGSDALPPEPVRPYYSFPAKIALDQQYLQVNGRQIRLQSGMSLSANIKLRKRKVIQIFTELFTRNIDSLKSVR